MWNGYMLRFKHTTLTIIRERGGMSLPNLRDYHPASLLNTVAITLSYGKRMQ